MIRIALAGTWHVHFGGYAGGARKDPRCEITAVWDPDPAAGQKAAADFGCAFEPDYDAMLLREDVDAVLVCAQTSLHKEIIVKAANAGKHIFTEKVLCFTEADARETADAVIKSGVKFTISFPWRARSDFKWVKSAVDDGLVGRVNYCRMRNCHNGASAGWLPESFFDKEICGGGAMMDLGAHGMYLLNWLLGRPDKCVSAFTNVIVDSVEDNALTAFTYENGAIGVNETSFVAQSDPFSFELVGDKGTILLGGFLDRACYNVGNGWVFPPLPKKDPEPLEAWIDAIANDTPAPYGPEDAVLLSRAMELAYAAD